MKVYVDTNVLVDFVCNRQGFVEEVKKLFAHGYMEEYELMTSALSIVNAVYKVINLSIMTLRNALLKWLHL